MNEQQLHWLVRPRTIRLLWRIFIAVLVATVLAGLLVHPHAEFGIDGTFGFFAWYGFVVCVIQVLAAKLLGLLLKRPDVYYDD